MKDELYAKIDIELYNQFITVEYLNKKIYLSYSDTKLVVDLNNIKDIINQVISDFGLDDNSNDLFKDIFDDNICPKLIKSVENIDGKLSFVLLNDIDIMIINVSKGLDITLDLDNIFVTLEVLYSDDEVIIPAIDESLYTDVEDILDLAKNVYDYINDMKFFIEISGNYQNITFNAHINYADRDFSLYAEALVNDLSITVMVKGKVVYVIVDDIMIKADISNYEDINPRRSPPSRGWRRRSP